MPRWTTQQWATSPPLTTSTDPQFAGAYPANGALQVPKTAVARLVLVDPLADVVAWTVYVDGVEVYPTPSATYRAKHSTFAGRRVLEITPAAGAWTPGARVKLESTATTSGNPIHYRSVFTIEQSTEGYRGDALLPIEQAVLSPMQVFLDLEPVRRFLLERALRDDAVAAMSSRDNVAVRALYQIAYETELQTVLNPYELRDPDAMAVRVLEKRAVLELDALLGTFASRVEAGLAALFTHGALPPNYKNTFADYRDSMLYVYRVAAPVVAVFLARAVEAQLTSTAVRRGHGFGTNFPFLLGGG